MRFSFSEITLPPIPNKLEGEKFENFKRTLSALMFSQRLQTFEDQSGRDAPWKPLSDLQMDKRLENLKRVPDARLQALSQKGFTHVKLLQDKGTLRQSFTPETGEGNAYRHVEIGEDFVRNSTNLKYAPIQNFGGTIVPRKSSVLVFTGPGGRKIFAKKVTIPARPFDEFTDAQESEMAELTEHYLND